MAPRSKNPAPSPRNPLGPGETKPAGPREILEEKPPRKKGVNGCQKGKDGERELARTLTALGFKAERGQQRAGGADSPDVKNLDPRLKNIHWEAKFMKTSHMFRKASLEKWDAQARRDAGPRKLPVVAHRWNNQTIWMCRVLEPGKRPRWMELEDFLQDYAGWGKP